MTLTIHARLLQTTRRWRAHSGALFLASSAMCAWHSLTGCRVSGLEQPSSRAPIPAVLHAPAERVVAIGDLHGDVAAARRALQLAGAIDPQDHWIGGGLVVVQTGDQVDRGDDDRPTLELLERVRSEAARFNGDVIALNGNHELMNVAGDFRYVTRRGFAEYDEFSRGWLAQFGVQRAVRGRAAAFAPGGVVARLFAKRPVVVIVGTTLFVHGGVLPEHVGYGLERINVEASRWMWGSNAEPPTILTGENSPVWTRAYSHGAPSAETCSVLDRALALAKVTRMVVGHTVQKTINSACDGHVFRIDVGLARTYGGPTQVLEMSGDQVRVLSQTAPQ